LNFYQIQKQLRAQLEPMTDKQLETNEKQATTLRHPITGETFHELAAGHLAQGVKRNPSDVARVKRIAPRFPGLVQALSAHFPDDEDFIWGDVPSPPNVRDANGYRQAVMCVDPCRAPRVHDLLYIAERMVARVALADDENVNDAAVHLHEERIDALASLMALFSLPDQYAASPVETQEWEAGTI